MENNLYLLTTNRYVGGYGAAVVCLGIFSSLEKANEAKEQAMANVNATSEWEWDRIDDIKGGMAITELTLDEVGHFTKFDRWGDYLLGDDKVRPLGGYAE